MTANANSSAEKRPISTQAKELAQTMLREYDDGGQEIFDTAAMTLAQLAGYYKNISNGEYARETIWQLVLLNSQSAQKDR